MKKIHSAAVLMLAVALAASGCSSTAEPEVAAPEPTETPVDASKFDTLVEDAQAEGAVRVYFSIPEPDQAKLAQGFTEKYGIQVESLRLGGNTLASRFEGEIAAGSPSGEVLLSTALDFLNTSTENGDLVAFEETGVKDMLEGFPKESILEDYSGIPIFQVMSTGFIYNTSMVEKQDIPKTWGDFVDSDLVSKSCAVSPDTSESLMVFMSTLREADGDEVLETLGQNVSRWYPSVVPMNEAVASGECAIGLNSAEFFTHAMKAQGAPVEFGVAPTAVYPVVSGAVATKAEHPNAARLFLHYSLSEEGSSTVFDPKLGSFGAFDAKDFPKGFSVPSPAEQKKILGESSKIMQLLGL